ncbi:MAG: sensor histidine kinase [Desulfobaccales bacterium]
MNLERKEAIRLEHPVSRSSPWAYVLIGALAGAVFEVLICEPLDIALQNLVEYLFKGASLRLGEALIPILRPIKWPGITMTGIIYGSALGYVFHLLREEKKHIQTLHQEFEIHVATLRHHYKNLAIGIKGFSGRIKRKMADSAECEPLEHDITILDDAAQRLSHVLGEELLFLRALASDSLTPVPGDFYPHLVHAVEDLQGLRFQEKEVRVEINGQPPEGCRDSLVFPFEPYSMEVILQNILSNAMKFGDLVQIRVFDSGKRVQVEVQDNGPGLDVEKLMNQLLTPLDRRGGESTHLGLKVSLHLLAKIGGHLAVRSDPGAGATFILEFPK